MRETTKKKLLGNKLYPVYRKLRFLRFRKRRLKEKRKQEQLIQKQEQLEVNRTIKDLSRQERVAGKKKEKNQRLERKREKRELRRKVKELDKQERTLNKQKEIQLKQEDKRERQEVRKRIREKGSQDGILEKKQSKQIQLKKKEAKHRKRKLTRYIIKRRLRKLLYEIKTFDRHSLKRWLKWILKITENKGQRNNFLIIFTNSLILFLISYFIIYIISQFLIVWISLSFDYKTILFYYKIYFNIDTGDWTSDSVKILFSIMPITGLILGTASMILYSLFKNESGIIKLLLLWGFVHGMVMFFGSLLIGTLLNKDFGWVIAYLYYKDTGKMVFSILSVFSLVAIGASLSKSFLISGNSYFNLITKKNRKFLLRSQVILPAIFGTIILIILKIPDNYYFATSDETFYEILKLLTVLLVIIPIIRTFKPLNEIYFDEEPRKIKLRWIYLIITIIIIAGYRLLLSDGVHFGK